MNKSELDIDLEKHVLYSDDIEKVIRQNLSGKFEEKEARDCWEKI